MLEKNINILLVEDDTDLGNVLAQFLKLNGFSVHLYRNGKDGLKAFNTNCFSICIFDVMLPEMDGFTLAEKISKTDSSVPFIFLTAKTMKEDKIRGLKAGADDYICKPFEPEELVLRIKNILKRTGYSPLKQELKAGSFKLNTANYQLIHPEKTFQLTEKESLLLEYLISNKNQLAKRTDILKKIWGEDDYFMGRSMDVFISRLRKHLKLDPSLSIKSVRGVGFMFKEK